MLRPADVAKEPALFTHVAAHLSDGKCVLVLYGKHLDENQPLEVRLGSYDATPSDGFDDAERITTFLRRGNDSDHMVQNAYWAALAIQNLAKLLVNLRRNTYR